MQIIGDEFNITAERVRRIKSMAELRLAEEIAKRVNFKVEIKNFW
jgi:DNA-directed RNA polymerase sigma subunit (sigma70/sigma32)